MIPQYKNIEVKSKTHVHIHYFETCSKIIIILNIVNIIFAPLKQFIVWFFRQFLKYLNTLSNFMNKVYDSINE